MEDFSKKLNELLTNTFQSILKIEEDLIQSDNHQPISMSELHLIEAVGKCRAPNNTISDVAASLRITLSSVTIGVNKLVKRGFLQKEKGLRDGRSVHIYLTSKGWEVNRTHWEFHRKMVEKIVEDLSDEEKAALLKGVEKLDSFFRENYQPVSEN